MSIDIDIRLYRGLRDWRTHLPNQGKYAVEKHHEDPQLALGDHRGNVECDHAEDERHVGPSETKQAQRRATHPIVETNIQSKEKKERMCSACARFPIARRSVSGGNERG